MLDHRRILTTTHRALGRVLAGASGVFSPTGPAAWCAVFLVFLFSASLLVITIPICYAGPQLGVVAREHESPTVKAVAEWLMGPATAWLRIDQSAMTVVCVALFFGVLLRVIEYCQLFDKLEGMLSLLIETPNDPAVRGRIRQQPEFESLQAGLDQRRADGDRTERVTQFHQSIVEKTHIRQYELYLVAIGLIGTLLAFYLAFARPLSSELSYSSLEETKRQMLVAVGTAAISSVAGIVFGMLAIPVLAEHLARRRRTLRELFKKSLAVVS